MVLSAMSLDGRSKRCGSSVIVCMQKQKQEKQQVEKQRETVKVVARWWDGL